MKKPTEINGLSRGSAFLGGLMRESLFLYVLEEIMNIIDKSLDDLKPYEKNPRNNSEAVPAVAKSIQEFGFKVPIVIDKNNVIVCGHTRYKAAKKLGLEKVPCIIADDLTDEQIKAFRLADNKTAELADWDMSKLEEELQGLSNDFDMEDFGFKELETLDEPSEIADDDFDDAPPEEPKAKRGDLYQLGEHRVLCGDATDQDDVERLLGGDKADLYLTDPPYNVAYVGKTKDALTIQNDKMADGDFRQFLVDAFSAADAVMKQGAAFYIWHADTEGFNFRGACNDIGWKVRQCLIWNKNTMVLGRQDYQWKHEPCLYGWNDGTHHWYSDRKQTTVIDMDKPVKSPEHPTMKPVPLFAYQIQCSTKPGDIVYDSFGGSGTTLIACEQLQRKAMIMELDPRYVDVIIKRWETLTGKLAVLMN